MLSFSSIPQRCALDLAKHMDIREVRRQNLMILRRQEGSLRALADRVETDPNYFSQILSENGKHCMGHALARRLERAFGKPVGWMDQPHNGLEDSKLVDIARKLGRLTMQQRSSVEALVDDLIAANDSQIQQQM